MQEAGDHLATGETRDAATCSNTGAPDIIGPSDVTAILEAIQNSSSKLSLELR